MDSWVLSVPCSVFGCLCLGAAFGLVDVVFVFGYDWTDVVCLCCSFLNARSGSANAVRVFDHMCSCSILCSVFDSERVHVACSVWDVFDVSDWELCSWSACICCVLFSVRLAGLLTVWLADSQLEGARRGHVLLSSSAARRQVFLWHRTTNLLAALEDSLLVAQDS